MYLLPVGSWSVTFWGLLPQMFKQHRGTKVVKYRSRFSTNVRDIFLARSSLSFSWSKAWWYSLDITSSFSMRLSNACSSEAVAAERIFLTLGRISLKRFILASEDVRRRSEQNLNCFNKIKKKNPLSQHQKDEVKKKKAKRLWPAIAQLFPHLIKPLNNISNKQITSWWNDTTAQFFRKHIFPISNRVIRKNNFKIYLSHERRIAIGWALSPGQGGVWAPQGHCWIQKLQHKRVLCKRDRSKTWRLQCKVRHHIVPKFCFH